VSRTVIIVLLITGCGWFAADEALPEPDPEMVRLRDEVRSLRAELRALREEVDVAHDVVVATPVPEPSPRSTAQRADFDRLEGDLDDVAELTDAVDLDLELVEEQVRDLQSRLAVTEAQVGSIEGILNNHADVLDALSADLSAMEDETSSLRPLNDLLYLDEDDDKIIVDGVDMVFRPGTNDDGSLRGTGPVVMPQRVE